MDGLRRNEYNKIDTLLELFPVVLILGVRQSGKTTISKQVRPNWKYFDLENKSDYDYLSSNLDFFFKEYSSSIIIDEAQEYPELFRQLRGVIDSDRKKNNRFILTGSSSPELIKHASDTLAGRVGILELGTLKRNEVKANKLPDFYKIFKERVSEESLDELKQIEVGEEDIIQDLLKGGYPEPVLSSNELKYDLWMNNYFKTYVERDIRKLFPKLDTIKFRRFISILSELSGNIINKAQLGRSLDINEVTVRDYLEIADKTFVWRIIPSYEKSKAKSIIKMPKGIMRDTGLLHFLSNIKSREDILRSPNLGQNFESYVIEELIKGINSLVSVTNFKYYYYRTKAGAEVDIVLEGSFGLLPVEIKFGQSTNAKQVISLKKFINENNCSFGIVVNNSQEIRMISEKIIQIPVSLI